MNLVEGNYSYVALALSDTDYASAPNVVLFVLLAYSLLLTASTTLIHIQALELKDAIYE